MLNIMRNIIVFGFCFVSVILFNCSGNKRGKKTELSYFLMYKTSMKPYYDYLEKEYERRNPHIDIKIERFGGSDLKPFETKVMLRFRANITESPKMRHGSVFIITKTCFGKQVLTRQNLPETGMNILNMVID